LQRALLRKAGATIAADNGATSHQLMAIFRWKTIKQAEIYTQKADQKAAGRRSNTVAGPGPIRIQRAVAPYSKK
jgi:hypothetical protein